MNDISSIYVTACEHNNALYKGFLTTSGRFWETSRNKCLYVP